MLLTINMSKERLDGDDEQLAQERVGSMPAPLEEGVCGVDKAIDLPRDSIIVRVVGSRNPTTGEIFEFHKDAHGTVREINLLPNASQG